MELFFTVSLFPRLARVHQCAGPIAYDDVNDFFYARAFAKMFLFFASACFLPIGSERVLE